MPTGEPIRGSVARVLTDRELVINKGSADGVELGMRFNVLHPRGMDITDPETGEVLGSVHKPKVQVSVTHLEPHLSVGRTFRFRERNVGGQGLASAMGEYASVSKLFEPPRMVREYETFRSDEAAWRVIQGEDIEESESFIKRGDPVEQVLVIEGEPTGPTPRHFTRTATTTVRPGTTATARVQRAGERAPATEVAGEPGRAT